MHPRDDNSALNSAHVQRRFDRAAASFDTVDFVHAVTRDGLFARLEPMAVEANMIIDLGSATGSGTRLLARRFRRARIVAVDLSHNMLAATRRKQRWFSRVSAAQANAEALPFADQSVDVVFANQLLPWIANPAQVFAEVARILRKDGLFLFATLGPDSLAEIRRAWSCVDGGQHANRFLDMHDIGDAAVRAGLRDPVLDVDYLGVTYRNADALYHDLTAMGARNCLRHRQRSLCAVSRFRTMTDALDRLRRDDLLTLDLELVYGHCWGGGRRPGAGEYHVAAGGIGRRRS
jgi:malonyl-CoA O-methyltransferase